MSPLGEAQQCILAHGHIGVWDHDNSTELRHIVLADGPPACSDDYTVLGEVTVLWQGETPISATLAGTPNEQSEMTIAPLKAALVPGQDSNHDTDEMSGGGVKSASR